MKIERTKSFGRIGEEIKCSAATKGMTGEERISMLEELRADVGKIRGHDYSQRFARLFSVVKPQSR